MAALPTWDLRTLQPTFSDLFSHPVGTIVGVDVGGDVWDTGGMTVAWDQWVFPPNDDAREISYVAGGNAIPRQVFPANQWVAAQCVIPLDGAAGNFPLVRATRSGDGYMLSNMGYTDGAGMSFSLVRSRGGVGTLLGAWFNQGDTNDFIIDGVRFSDNFWAVLEAATLPDGVHLRASIAGPAPYSGGFSENRLGPFPGNIAYGVTGQFCARLLGEIVDPLPGALLVGQPGISGGGGNDAGGLANFNAGAVEMLDASVLSPGGTAVRVGGNRKHSTTITVSYPPAPWSEIGLPRVSLGAPAATASSSAGGITLASAAKTPAPQVDSMTPTTVTAGFSFTISGLAKTPPPTVTGMTPTTVTVGETFTISGTAGYP